MDNLASRAFRKLSPAQSAVLAVMEIDRYVRRQLPRTPGPLAANLNAVLWSAIQANMPLALAISRAGGVVDAHAWCADWVAAGLPLPDLAALRSDSQAKRSLWGQMRRRKAATKPQEP